MDFESSEKKGGRKLSGASAKTENASVKGRKMSRFEKQESKGDILNLFMIWLVFVQIIRVVVE